MSNPVVAVVLAAGIGSRFDPQEPKQLVSILKKPIVCWSIESFERNANVSDIIVVVNSVVRKHVESLIEECQYSKVRCVINGGKERVDSTLAALQLLQDQHIPHDAKILIHDGVRPFISQEVIDNCVRILDEYDAATVAIPSTDTILLTRTNERNNDIIQNVPERTQTFRAQTPQVFRFHTIRDAYILAAKDPQFHPTDDTRVVVDYMPQVQVGIVQGSESNIKITTRADIPVATQIAQTL
ncbi:MAG: IspD/TarI family cytidylyltransferase [Bifidobacteriaceae bacterium]|nr:IspD/TarI family cytidylyltransferase [Bifidobacteriaceae bacterium]